MCFRPEQRGEPSVMAAAGSDVRNSAASQLPHLQVRQVHLKKCAMDTTTRGGQVCPLLSQGESAMLMSESKKWDTYALCSFFLIVCLPVPIKDNEVLKKNKREIAVTNEQCFCCVFFLQV